MKTYGEFNKEIQRILAFYRNPYTVSLNRDPKKTHGELEKTHGELQKNIRIILYSKELFKLFPNRFSLLKVM